MVPMHSPGHELMERSIISETGTIEDFEKDEDQDRQIEMSASMPVMRKMEEENFFQISGKPPLPEANQPDYKTPDRNSDKNESIMDITEISSFNKSPDMSSFTLERQNKQ